VRLSPRLVVPLAVAGLGLSVLPAAAGGPSLLPEPASERASQALGIDGDDDDAAAAAGPFDYIAQADQLSQPLFPKTVKEVTTFEAHDGEQLYVEITRPDPAVYPELTDLPVILEASPYHGTVADRDGTRMFPDPTDENGEKVGLTGYFAQRGYAVAMMGLRGTGRSTGCLDQLGQDDKKDMTTVVEALADAEWSNGRVGMTGHSYVGSTPSMAAAAGPRGLVTIVPSAGLASMYDHQFQSGVPYNLQYIGPQVAYEGLALDRDLPKGTPSALGNKTGDNSAAGPNAQTGCGLPNSAALAGSGQVTGQYEAWHAQRDHGAGAAASDVSVFMIHGVNDNAARIPAAEWFFGGRFDRDQDKVWIGQWDHGSTNGRCGGTDGKRALHPTCRFDQQQYAIHAWFDRELKQMDVETGPAVEAFLNGERAATASSSTPRDPATWGTKVVTADSWSQPGAAMGLFPDASDGSLGFAPPTESASGTFSGGVQAGFVRAGAGKLAFTSEPLSEDTVFLGLPELDLRAAVTSAQQVTHLTAELYRIDAQGGRELANVCAIQPGLRFGVATPAPVVPGQAMDLPMQCFTAAHLVKAGDRLELLIGTNTQHHFTFAGDPQVTVFTGPGVSSYSLPTVAADLHDDVVLRDGNTTPDGASGSTGEAPAPGETTSFDGMQRGAIMLP
jgi:putative CocE/NonD family hydrolase